MKYLTCVLLILISGCSTVVPVTAKFPEVPTKLQAKCPQLEKLKDEVKLSEVSKTITMNYSTYYECAVKVDSWNEWYQVNKLIFEGIK
jgi:hypothetical protein|tara:strand:- start:126 stop:389 length:264 start_codon:yes stop_codon:yes gene_type:complete